MGKPDGNGNRIKKIEKEKRIEKRKNFCVPVPIILLIITLSELTKHINTNLYGEYYYKSTIARETYTYIIHCSRKDYWNCYCERQ